MTFFILAKPIVLLYLLYIIKINSITLDGLIVFITYEDYVKYMPTLSEHLDSVKLNFAIIR